MITKQQIFDKVVTHLFKQKIPSIGSCGECSYRGNNGLKCALGIFIPDEIYNNNMEGDISSLKDFLLKIKKRKYRGYSKTKRILFDKLLDLLETNYDILQDLQYTHDNCTLDDEEKYFLLDSLKKDLIYVAKIHDLQISHLKKLQ